MSLKYTSRTIIETSQHGLIDAELKSLKLLARRLQSNLTLLATELQLLHRLYYKNKNQHRGALFWRNIAEARRCFEKASALNLQDSIPALRATFYGSTETTAPMKGPWTHFPDRKYLIMQGNLYKTAAKLMEKTSEVCIKAYKSFHRSLQSGAFLQILLMFAAISSRGRALSLELHDVSMKAYKCTHNLLSIVPHGDSSLPEKLENIMSVPLVVESLTVAEAEDMHTLFSTSPTPSVIETSNSKNVRKNTQMVNTLPKPKKKKRKIATDEIDDIFGF